jgi:hypothetical protein
MANLPEIIGALAADALSAFSVPGGSTAGVAIAAYGKRRSDQAREILFGELRSGGKSPEQVSAQDDGIAVIHGYLRAAWEGRARINLRLLAKAIVGQLQAGNLVADDFFLHAESLAGLSRDEIILISTLFRHHGKIPDVPEDQMGEREKHTPWFAATEELAEKGWPKDKIWAVAGRCTRSGFVIAKSAWDDLAYKASPMLLDLCKTVDFADALAQEA